jgi:hypothetical protein
MILSHWLVVMCSMQLHPELTMPFIKPLVSLALALASLATQATTISLATDGQWQSFGVDSLSALSGGTEWIDNINSNSAGYGTPLDFQFTIAPGHTARLTVVDAAMAGDAFDVYNHGVLLGATSSVPMQDYGNSPPDIGLDHDAALLNSAFSRGVFDLGAGSYRISGVLTQSMQFEGNPINATAGAIKVDLLSAVPEPGALELLLAAVGMALLLWARITSR